MDKNTKTYDDGYVEAIDNICKGCNDEYLKCKDPFCVARKKNILKKYISIKGEENGQ